MKFSVFSQSKLGSSLLSSALGWVGQGRLKNIMPVRRKNFRAKPKQAGKKEGGLGEGIFARLLCPPKAGWGMGKRFCNSALAEYQNRKIFVSLIEKNLRGT
ncbi:MAG TPA: hypothetical protein PLM44_02970 [bacterium]|jgi:hypothetical protein|nr:hypothetical protein [bacterium]